MNDPHDVDERLADWVDGRMSERERTRFVAELRVSPKLRSQLAEYERTVAAVRAALGAPTTPLPLADRVFAQIAAGPALASASSSPQRLVARFGWTVAAAVALLGIALWVDRSATLAPRQDRVSQIVAPDPAGLEAAPVGSDPLATPKPDAPAVPAGTSSGVEPPAKELADDVAGRDQGREDLRRSAKSAPTEPTAEGTGLVATETEAVGLAKDAKAQAAPDPALRANQAALDEGSGAPVTPVAGHPEFQRAPAPEASRVPAVEPPTMKSAGPVAPAGEPAPGAPASGIPTPGAPTPVPQDKSPGGSASYRGGAAAGARGAPAPSGPSTGGPNFGANRLADVTVPVLEVEGLLVAEADGEVRKRADEDAKDSSKQKSGEKELGSKNEAPTPLPVAALQRELDAFLQHAMQAEQAEAARWLTAKGALVLAPIVVPLPAAGGDGRAKADAAARELVWLVEGPREDLAHVLARVGELVRARRWRLQNGETRLPARREASTDGGAGGGDAARTQGAAPAATDERLVLRVRLRPR